PVTPAALDLIPTISERLGLPRGGIAAVIALLDEGSTVPFIARYRKERTGGLDEVQIRAIEEQREYLVELETRRAAILASVAEQIADPAEVRAFVRREFSDTGELVSEVVPGKGDDPTKFEQYYKFSEAVKTIPSHRFLAIRRGEAEGVLRAHVVVDTAKVAG